MTRRARRLGLVTCAAAPDPTGDDLLLAPPLRELGWEVHGAPWDAAETDWSSFDCCIFRSCWNYSFRLPEFLSWLYEMETLAVQFWNPVQTVRWNLRKSYLRELEAAGLPVVPTVYVAQRERVDLEDLVRAREWREFVVKPDVGLGGYQIERVRQERAREVQGLIEGMLTTAGLLVQPYLPEVESRGELSLIFFGHEYSHAVLKTPPPGEFRVQLHHGGTAERYEADAEAVSLAREVIAACGEPPLYARVDVIPDAQRLLVVEVELIDPVLYLALDRAAPRRFARAFAALG